MDFEKMSLKFGSTTISGDFCTNARGLHDLECLMTFLQSEGMKQ